MKSDCCDSDYDKCNCCIFTTVRTLDASVFAFSVYNDYSLTHSERRLIKRSYSTLQRNFTTICGQNVPVFKYSVCIGYIHTYMSLFIKQMRYTYETYVDYIKNN